MDKKPVAERYLCDCGKWITLTKDGVYRYHLGNERATPWNKQLKVCDQVGLKP